MKLDKVIASITLRDVVYELVVFAACLLIAFAANIYAIVHYQTSWSELYTDIGFTMVLALVIYVARCVFKLLVKAICYIVCKVRCIER